MSYAKRVMDSTPGLPPADALVAAREADAQIAALESRLAASEAGAAGLRAALEPLFGSGNALSNLAFNISQPGWPKLRAEELPKIRQLADDWDTARRAARQALQSNAGAKVADENRRFREMLFMAHTQGRGYHDDGELQDNTKHPFIDWKRDSLEHIESALRERAKAALDKEGV